MAIKPGDTITNPVTENPTLPIGSCIEARGNSYSMSYYKVQANKWFCVEHQNWFENVDFANNKNTLRSIEIEDVPVGTVIDSWTKVAPDLWCHTDQSVVDELTIEDTYPTFYKNLLPNHTTTEATMSDDYNRMNQEDTDRGTLSKTGNKVKDNLIQGFHIGWSTAATKKVVDLIVDKLKERWPENAAMLDDPAVRKLMEGIIPLLAQLAVNSEYRDKVPAADIIDTWSQNATIGLSADATQQLIMFSVGIVMPMLGEVVDVIKGEAKQWEGITGEKLLTDTGEKIDFEEIERQAKEEAAAGMRPVEQTVVPPAVSYKTVGDS